jgi:hypothetical protein
LSPVARDPSGAPSGVEGVCLNQRSLVRPVALRVTARPPGFQASRCHEWAPGIRSPRRV